MKAVLVVLAAAVMLSGCAMFQGTEGLGNDLIATAVHTAIVKQGYGDAVSPDQIKEIIAILEASPELQTVVADIATDPKVQALVADVVKDYLK